MADDNLAADYLKGRQEATFEDNMRRLKGIVGGGEMTEQDAVALPKAQEKVEAEDRTRRQSTVGGIATQAVGGVRDAVVQSGKAIEDMTAWLRKNTPLGELPEGPKLQIKLPAVREPETTAQSLTRGVAQFLTGFAPFFKATKAMGLGTGAAGAAAGALTDFAVFDPNDPRVSNMINNLAPALRSPLTDYLAAGPDDSGAEGRFKNALEGLALGGLTEGVFKAARVLKATKSITRDELRSLATSERGSARLGGGSAQEAPSVTTFTTAKGSTYTVGGGGTTVRNKAARPEHPGDFGIQDASERTIYADQAALDALSEFGARGTAKKRLAQAQDGRWGIQYTEGPNAGKFEKRTMASVTDTPAVGLHPIELFEGGSKVHFGNKITEVRQGVAEAPKITPLVQVKKVTPEQAKEFLAANPDAVGLKDRVLKVSWEQLGDQAGLEEVINKTTKAFRDEIEVARRGKISDENLRTLARELDMPVEDFLGRRTGAALNAEQSLALVSIMGASAKRLRGLATEVANGNLAARQPMLDQLSLHAAIQEQAFGARAEAGRALRVWGMQADGSIAHASKLAKTAEEMTGMGGGLDAERMAHMILTLDSPGKLAKMTREATKPGWADMASEYWINALLSNPTTHMANFLSNTLTTFWAIPERAWAAQLSSGGQGVVSGEAGAMFAGLVGGTWDALRVAGEAFRKGVPVREGSKLEGMSRKAISGANMGVSGDMGRAMDLLGTSVRLPGRFLMASDEFFKVINFRMELNAQAVRQAAQEGLEGKAAGRRVAELLQDGDFLKRVKPMADEFADYQTFTKALGETGSALQAWRDSHPAAKLVMPFLRTPINIFKYVGERTPFLNRLSSEVRADLAAGGARADMARAKVQLGGMVMASTAVLASSGYITGRGPRDPNLRREWLETNQPYSVKIGGTWYAYNRMDPIGAMLGMAADFSDMAGHLNEIDASQLAAVTALSISNNLLSKSYLTGLADVLEGIQSPTQDAAQTVRKMAGTIIPAGVAQAAHVWDPTQREVNSVFDAMIARVPGYSSRLPPRLNLWAEPVQYNGGFGADIASPIYTKTPELKPVSEEMQRLQVSVNMPSKWLFPMPKQQKDPLAEPSANDGIPLEPEEYAKYVKLSAGYGLGKNMPLLKDALQKLIESDTYKRQTDGSDGMKAKLLKDVILRYRQAAQMKLEAESPELRAQMERRAWRQVEALTGRKRGQAPVVAPSSGGTDSGGSVQEMLGNRNLPSTLGR